MSGSRLARGVGVSVLATAMLSGNALASSVGPYGVARVSMLVEDVDGRPLTFSESDIFACVQTPGDPRASVYRVPYGYVTDQTSIPRRLAGLLIGNDGRMAVYANAAIVHDYLYASGDRGNKAARAAADRAMSELLRSEGVSGSVVRAIDSAFAAMRGAAGWADAVISFFGGDRFAAKRWVQSMKGAFGSPEEWKRWANPYTLRLIEQERRQPWSRDAAKPATWLDSCLVFDGPGDDPDRHRLLHACLHHRFRSADDRPLIQSADGGRLVPWPAPRMPTALVDYVAQVDQAPAGSCDVFAR